MPDFDKMRDHIQFSVTGEGLRIDLLETEQGMFFVTGSPTPTAAGERLLAALAAELARIGNCIVIEGHTDARPFRNAAPAAGYSNWELSADRANAARRLLHAHGVLPGQVVEVRGFADRQLHAPRRAQRPAQPPHLDCGETVTLVAGHARPAAPVWFQAAVVLPSPPARRAPCEPCPPARTW